MRQLELMSLQLYMENEILVYSYFMKQYMLFAVLISSENVFHKILMSSYPLLVQWNIKQSV